jgi:peptidoglycan/LPS O-acetylase OafA/YrhL
LTSIDKKSLPVILNKLDQLLGDLSYPIFLCHWHAATILAFVVPQGLAKKGFGLFASGLALTFCGAFLINRFIEKPIEKFRTNIRTRANRKEIQ